MAITSLKTELFNLLEDLSAEEVGVLLQQARRIRSKETVPNRLSSRLKAQELEIPPTSMRGIPSSEEHFKIPHDVMQTFGAWNGFDKSTEEIIEDIYSQRTVVEDSDDLIE